MKKLSNILCVVIAVLTFTIMLTSCNGNVPTYEINIKGIVSDSEGNPLEGVTVNILQTQRAKYGMFGPYTQHYTEVKIGVCTTDKNGFYRAKVQSEGLNFRISVFGRDRNWDREIIYSGAADCSCTSNNLLFNQDIIVGTETEYYTGTEWQKAVEVSTLNVNLIDSIYIHLIDGGTILTTGIFIDTPWEDKNGQLLHSMESWYNMYYSSYEHNRNMPPDLTEFNVKFQIDTTAHTWCSIPYADRCYLQVASSKKNSYYIPLTIK